MWSHCIVCSADLGGNQDLEEFQIGSRLAFDGGKGRLWVVCPRCERWNLVPMDQRWEAFRAEARAAKDSHFHGVGPASIPILKDTRRE